MPYSAIFMSRWNQERFAIRSQASQSATSVDNGHSRKKQVMIPMKEPMRPPARTSLG